MNPKLCLNTSTIKPQPLMEKIRLAGEVGYDGIELWINDLYEYIGQGGEISDLKRPFQIMDSSSRAVSLYASGVTWKAGNTNWY